MINREHTTQSGVVDVIEMLFMSKSYSGTTGSDGYLEVAAPATGTYRILGASVRITDSQYSGIYGTKISAIPYFSTSGAFKGVLVLGDFGPVVSTDVAGYVYFQKLDLV